MIKYTHFIEPGDIYNCLMSELRTTTLKSLDEDKQTLLNSYLSLLSDTVLATMPDFLLECCFYLKGDIVYLHIGDPYLFIGTFDLSKTFNKNFVLDNLNDKNLIILGFSHKSSLSDFRKIRVLFMDVDFNERLSEYLNFIADDLSFSGQKNDIFCRVNYNTKGSELTLFNSYPFLDENITFTINIEEDFNKFNIIDKLNLVTNLQLNDPKANFFVSIQDGFRFLETIHILEKALCWEEKLTKLYFERSCFESGNEVNFLFFNLNDLKRKIGISLRAKNKTGITIKINPSTLDFEFKKDADTIEKFTWIRTDHIQQDILMVHSLFMIYFEKFCGYKVTDLKREFQLLEMINIE